MVTPNDLQTTADICVWYDCRYRPPTIGPCLRAHHSEMIVNVLTRELGHETAQVLEHKASGASKGVR
jgi:hypothetical protein